MIKNNNKVKVIATSYLEGSKYTSHVGGLATVVKPINKDEWESPYVSEYLVKIGKKEYVLPEYSLEEF